MTDTLPDHKRGDDYGLVCTYKEDGTATSVSGYTLTAQMRDARGELVQELTVQIDSDQAANPGRFTLAASAAETSVWPVGVHYMDIQITTGGITRSSDTFRQPVIKDQTR